MPRIIQRFVGGDPRKKKVPQIALKLIGGEWFVVDGNTTTPDGYYQLNGSGQLVIVQGANSGGAITLAPESPTITINI